MNKLRTKRKTTSGVVRYSVMHAAAHPPTRSRIRVIHHKEQDYFLAQMWDQWWLYDSYAAPEFTDGDALCFRFSIDGNCCTAEKEGGGWAGKFRLVNLTEADDEPEKP